MANSVEPRPTRARCLLRPNGLSTCKECLQDRTAFPPFLKAQMLMPRSGCLHPRLELEGVMTGPTGLILPDASSCFIMLSCPGFSTGQLRPQGKRAAVPSKTKRCDCRKAPALAFGWRRLAAAGCGLRLGFEMCRYDHLKSPKSPAIKGQKHTAAGCRIP